MDAEQEQKILDKIREFLHETMNVKMKSPRCWIMIAFPAAYGTEDGMMLASSIFGLSSKEIAAAMSTILRNTSTIIDEISGFKGAKPVGDTRFEFLP